MINTGQQSGNPATLVNGDLWYDTATDKLRTVEGGAAANVVGLATSAFSGVAKISVGTEAPTSPAAGDLWIDTT